MDKYFVGEHAKIEKNGKINGCQILVDNSESIQTVDFINILSLKNFSIDFSVPEEYSSFSKMSFVFTDVNNKNKVAKISYIKDGEITKISINDTITEIISGAKFTNTFTLSYKSLNNIFEDGTGVSVPNIVDFTSDEIFLSLVFEGVKSEAAVIVKTLCNQSMLAIRDTGTPMVDIVNLQSGLKNYNETVTFEKLVSICDVFSPISDEYVRFSVSTPDGGYATATDGTVLNHVNISTNSYELTFNEYGTYTITYIVNDPLGSSYYGIFMIDVVDIIKPVITLSEDFEIIGYKLGSTINLLSFNATDNYTESNKLVVVVSVINPHGVMTFVDNGKYTVNEAGYYRVVYYCYDEAGNFATASYRIYVA